MARPWADAPVCWFQRLTGISMRTVFHRTSRPFINFLITVSRDRRLRACPRAVCSPQKPGKQPNHSFYLSVLRIPWGTSMLAIVPQLIIAPAGNETRERRKEATTLMKD